MTFHLMFVHSILVRFGLLDGSLLTGGCSLGWPCVLFLVRLLVILAISFRGQNCGSDCSSSW